MQVQVAAEAVVDSTRTRHCRYEVLRRTALLLLYCCFTAAFFRLMLRGGSTCTRDTADAAASYALLFVSGTCAHHVRD